MKYNTLELPEEALVEELWKENDNETPLELVEDPALLEDIRFTLEEIFPEAPAEQETEPEPAQQNFFLTGRCQPY